MKIECRRGTAGCGRRLDEDQQKRSAQTLGSCDRSLETNQQIQRRRVDVSYDPSMETALQHGTCIDEESFKKVCIKEKGKRGGIHQPLHSTWAADFMMRQDAGRIMLGSI